MSEWERTSNDMSKSPPIVFLPTLETAAALPLGQTDMCPPETKIANVKIKHTENP